MKAKKIVRLRDANTGRYVSVKDSNQSASSIIKEEEVIGKKNIRKAHFRKS